MWYGMVLCLWIAAPSFTLAGLTTRSNNQYATSNLAACSLLSFFLSFFLWMDLLGRRLSAATTNYNLLWKILFTETNRQTLDSWWLWNKSRWLSITSPLHLFLLDCCVPPHEGTAWPALRFAVRIFPLIKNFLFGTRKQSELNQLMKRSRHKAHDCRFILIMPRSCGPK